MDHRTAGFGLLFDKDGTLFSFDETWGGWTESVIAQIAADGAEAAALAGALGFDPGTRRFARESPVIAGTPDAAIALMTRACPRLADIPLMAILEEAAQDVALVPPLPLRPLLEGFVREGIAIGLATNDSDLAAHAHLETAGVHDLFSFIAGYDSGHGAKPDPGQMRAFLEHTGLAPARSVMIGDSLHDLRAGRAAGMLTVGVGTGPATLEDLAPHADAVMPDIGHLPAWLASLPRLV